MSRQLFAFWLSHRHEFLVLLAQHVVLVAAAVGIAVVLGVPLGILAARRPRLAAPLVGIANVVQTIPSLAMFGFLLPLPLVGGLGARAAIFVLILYGLLPILRTTIAGLRGIDRAIVEAATALGMTPRERLWRVELPLALPAIVAGIRFAAVLGVGTATVPPRRRRRIGRPFTAGCRWWTARHSRGAIPARCSLAVDGVLLIERAFAGVDVHAWRRSR